MRRARWSGFRVAMPMCAALVVACQGEEPSKPPPAPTPLCAASDPTHVVAPQRVVLLTSTQLINMIRLVSDDAAQLVLDGNLFPVITDYAVRFPPAAAETFKTIPDSTSLVPFNITAQKVGEHVRDNFATVTKCALPAADACATGYLAALAQKAYRRKLTDTERSRFATLYEALKSHLVNGRQVTRTVEQATGLAVSALLLSPQLLWRWEVGAEASSSPPGVYLTDAELASSLSFFLTDRPPDDALAADADSGVLRQNLKAHVDRILATRAARDWLTHVMRAYFLLNQLPGTAIDERKFPIVAGGALYADLAVESRMFLDDVMWNGKVTDLLTSRRAFLNSNLASMIYRVPVPPGATPTNFVQTSLPVSERSGMLTNAGFITTRARADGVAVVPRGLGVKGLFTCVETPPPPDDLPTVIIDPIPGYDMQTAQEQVAFRAGYPACGSCHASFDPYGLALDWYDVVGVYRTVDHLNKPIDGHTRLPAEVGGAEVGSAVELAEVLSKGDVFTNCMAVSALQYALDARIELPLASRSQAGCAAAGIAHRLRHSDDQSFTDLFEAIATSSTFVLRKVEATSATAARQRDNVPRSPSPGASGADNDLFDPTAAPPAADAVLTDFDSRRIVFDFVADELDLLRASGPVDVQVKLDQHFAAVRAMTTALTTAINRNYP